MYTLEKICTHTITGYRVSCLKILNRWNLKSSEKPFYFAAGIKTKKLLKTFFIWLQLIVLIYVVSQSVG